MMKKKTTTRNMTTWRLLRCACRRLALVVPFFPCGFSSSSLKINDELVRHLHNRGVAFPPVDFNDEFGALPLPDERTQIEN